MLSLNLKIINGNYKVLNLRILSLKQIKMIQKMPTLTHQKKKTGKKLVLIQYQKKNLEN